MNRCRRRGLCELFTLHSSIYNTGSVFRLFLFVFILLRSGCAIASFCGFASEDARSLGSKLFCTFLLGLDILSWPFRIPGRSALALVSGCKKPPELRTAWCWLFSFRTKNVDGGRWCCEREQGTQATQARVGTSQRVFCTRCSGATAAAAQGREPWVARARGRAGGRARAGGRRSERRPSVAASAGL